MKFPKVEFLRCEVKGVDVATRIVEGWASTVNPDQQGDVWLPTAWRKSLYRWKERGSRPKFVGYHQHALATGHSPVLGVLREVKIEELGVSFRAWLAETELGNEHLYLYDKKAMDSFSTGYFALAALFRDSRDDKGKDLFARTLEKWGIKEADRERARRILVETEILEISCVVAGMNLEALTKAMASDDERTREYATKALERMSICAGLEPDLELRAAPLPDLKGSVEVFDFHHPAFDRLDLETLRKQAEEQAGELEVLGPPAEGEKVDEPTADDPLSGLVPGDEEKATEDEAAEGLEEKPYPNEHAARLTDPDKYARFSRVNDKFGEGIHAIYGHKNKAKKEGDSELQAIRFDAGKFTVEQAKAWLKKHDHKPILFEPATKKDISEEIAELRVELREAMGETKRMIGAALAALDAKKRSETASGPGGAGGSAGGGDSLPEAIEQALKILEGDSGKDTGSPSVTNPSAAGGATGGDEPHTDAATAARNGDADAGPYATLTEELERQLEALAATGAEDSED